MKYYFQHFNSLSPFFFEMGFAAVDRWNVENHTE